MINRAVVTLEPKEPYFTWARTVPGLLGPAALNREDSLAFLIPPMEEQTSSSCADVEEVWGFLFEAELSVLTEDEEPWPKDRTYEMFLEWFEVRYHSMVFDLCEGEVSEEEDPGA